MRTQVFDSEDPNLPDLPSELLDESAVLSSDDELLSDTSSFSSSDDSRHDGILGVLSRTISRRNRAHSSTNSVSTTDSDARTGSESKSSLPPLHLAPPYSGVGASPPLTLSRRSTDVQSTIIAQDSDRPNPGIMYSKDDTRPDNPVQFSEKHNHLNDTEMESHRRKHKRPKRKARRYSSTVGGPAAAKRRAGWEPGVDIRTTDVVLQSVGSVVTIVDYNAHRYKVVHTEVRPVPDDDLDMSDRAHGNHQFWNHLVNRPSWSKVRWVNVNGLSWDAISTISKHYQLHRLAIEDMVDIPQRTKTDIYPNHTFCCLPLHKLVSRRPVSSQSSNFLFWRSKSNTMSKDSRTISNSSEKGSGMSTKLHKAATISRQISGQPSLIRTPNSGTSLQSVLASTPMNSIYQWNNQGQTLTGKSSYLDSRRPLASHHRGVGVEQVSLFLSNRDTVISFFEHSAADIERPILARLSTESTILRESSDASILLQAVIDAIVDLIQPIMNAYRIRMDELEVDALVNPSMSHTQDLHLMAGELSMLRNTIVPITSLVTSLRDHSQTDQESGVSELAKMYLSDVADHTMSCK